MNRTWLILLSLALLLGVGLGMYTTIRINEPKNETVRITPGERGQYDVYSKKEKQWQRITGPKLGLTSVEGSEKTFADIEKFVIMEDGAAVVKFKDGTWSVWEQDLLGKKLAESLTSKENK
jgi:hypothetical protein